jgi:hypothetical protein
MPDPDIRAREQSHFSCSTAPMVDPSFDAGRMLVPRSPIRQASGGKASGLFPEGSRRARIPPALLVKGPLEDVL